MSRNLFFPSLAGAVLLCGCSSQSIPEMSTPPAESPPVREITFRWQVPVGYRYTTLGHEKAGYQSGGRRATLKYTTTHELIKAEDGKYTWKTINDQELEAKGDMNLDKKVAEEVLDKNRLEYTTTDAAGNTISSEGAKDEIEVVEGQEWPSRPLRVGDTWTYIWKDKHNGKQTASKRRLAAISTINGKDYAIVEFDLTGAVTGNGKMWVDLTTHITVKAGSKYDGITDVGNPYTSEVDEHALGEDHEPLLP